MASIWSKEIIECENKISKIHEQIDEYNKMILELKLERCKVISKMKHIDMDIVLECIIENGLSSDEMMELIVEAAEKKRRACFDSQVVLT